VKAVLPGSTRTLSRPARRRIGQRRSGSCAARISVPSDVCGAARFAANATA